MRHGRATIAPTSHICEPHRVHRVEPRPRWSQCYRHGEDGFAPLFVLIEARGSRARAVGGTAPPVSQAAFARPFRLAVELARCRSPGRDGETYRTSYHCRVMTHLGFYLHSKISNLYAEISIFTPLSLLNLSNLPSPCPFTWGAPFQPPFSNPRSAD